MNSNAHYRKLKKNLVFEIKNLISQKKGVYFIPQSFS